MIYCGNCVDVMKEHIEDNSIDLTVTSPPYDNLRTYKGYIFDFEAIAQQLYRVTKKGGIAVWIVNDATKKGSETGTSFKQALYFKDIGFNLHDTMIWNKNRFSPQMQHPRYQPAFEYMFVFCKGYPPKTFNPLKRLNKSRGNLTHTNGQRNTNDSFRHKSKKYNIVNEYSMITNVWIYPPASTDKNHPAPFPEQLARDHILSWSNENDIVFDPMCGSGTTLKMAKGLNRRYIGIDISQEYVDLSNKRVDAIEQGYLL